MEIAGHYKSYAKLEKQPNEEQISQEFDSLQKYEIYSWEDPPITYEYESIRLKT